MVKWNPDKAYASIRWRKLRAMQLKKHPICALCDKSGIVSRATVVDHITPHKGNYDIMWDTDNLQSLCATCHSGTKAVEEAIGYSQACDKNGIPLHPDHPWLKDKRNQ